MPFINGGHLWIVLLLVIALVILGPGKLPELGGAIGKGIREFKSATTNLKGDISTSAEATPEPAAAEAATPEPARAASAPRPPAGA